jgi:hypothetical protein
LARAAAEVTSADVWMTGTSPPLPSFIAWPRDQAQAHWLLPAASGTVS